MSAIARGIATERERAAGAIAADRARAERALAALREAAREQFARLRLGAASEPPRRRLAWGLVALALCVVPFVFNAARQSEWSASVEIFPRQVGPYPGPTDPGYYNSLLGDTELQQEMLLNAKAKPDAYRSAVIRRTENRLILSVDSEDPARAQELVNKLGPQLVNASAREIVARAPAEAAALRGQLRYQRPLAPSERQRIRSRLRALRGLEGEPLHRAVLGPPPGLPSSSRWADRVADVLPGEPPERSRPAAAGLAGLLLAGALWVLGLVLAPPTTAPARAARAARAPPADGEPWAIVLPSRAYAALLAAAALAAVAIIMVVGSPLKTFRLDEWFWLSDRQGSSLNEYLRPHYEHLSALPVAVFKAMFVNVGLEHYWVYRLVVAVLAVFIGVLVYVYAARRLGRGWAFVPAILTMVIGQGAYDIFWPFQIGYNLSIASGVGALLCFDRPGRRSDLIASLLVVIALLSSSIGLAVLATAVVEVALSRGQRLVRAARVVAAPAVLYVVWYLHYDPPRSSQAAAPGEAVRLIFEIAGTALTALTAVPIGLRLPAAFVLVLAVAIGLTRADGRYRRRLLVACSLPLAFWVLLVIGRGSTGTFQLLDSRYIYPGAVFTACVLAEVLRGTTRRAPAWVAAVVALAVVGATANNVRYLRDAVNFDADVRAKPARIEAAALFVAGQAGPIDPAYGLSLPLFQERAVASNLVVAFDRYGPPVDDPDATISKSPPKLRARADRAYFGARGLRARATGRPASVKGCRTLPGPSTEVPVPEAGLAIRTSNRGPVGLRPRRWGSTYQPAGPIPDRGWSRITPGPDSAGTPVRAVITGYRVRVCRV